MSRESISCIKAKVLSVPWWKILKAVNLLVGNWLVHVGILPEVLGKFLIAAELALNNSSVVTRTVLGSPSPYG